MLIFATSVRERMGMIVFIHVKPNIYRRSEKSGLRCESHYTSHIYYSPPFTFSLTIKGTLLPPQALNVGIGCKLWAAKSNKNSF